MSKRLSLSFIILIASSACSPGEKPVENSPVATSADALAKKLKDQGIYEGVQTSTIDQSYEVMSAKNESRYFLQDGKVVSSSRLPKTHERALMYWREYFKGKSYREREVRELDLKRGHRIPKLQLACDELGMGVIYDPEHEAVTRVFYYASHP